VASDAFEEEMISYAQNAEDVLLRRVFPHERDGFYVDVGAHHPVHDSITNHFYQRGWRGINVEPIPAMHRLLRDARPRDVNLNIGLSNARGSSTFYESLTHPALSTFVESNARRHMDEGETFREVIVETSTLAAVCAEHAAAEIDFLSIDVEGLERQVLAGADFERWRPRVIVIESTHPNQRRPTHDLWEPLLLDARYEFAFFDGLNRFYLRAENAADRERLAVPANVFDNYVPYRFHLWAQERDAHAQLAQALEARLARIKQKRGRFSRLWR